jgi:transcriptional regulator PpsR
MMNIAQPDVTLHLDLEGVIRDVQLSEAFAEEPVGAWIGRPWIDTIDEHGGAKVQRLLEHARESGVSAFRQLTQRFPSGLELPMEYTTVRLGGQGGLIAIGKNLQAVAELQSRLIAAQQAMERDYWKLREVETRCRLLFDASNEAVLVLRAGDLRIVEANPAAIRALGLAPAGREFLPEVAPREREPFQAMLLRVREQGKAPGIMIHLGSERTPWLVRASLMSAEPGSVFLLQLAAVGAGRAAAPTPVPAVEELIERVPDAFLVLDGNGVILHANRAFLELAQVGAKASVVGESLRRWLGRPGADLKVLLANVQRHGSVRLFSTTLQGELGSESEVEISGAGSGAGESGHIALLLRDVGQRLPPAGAGNRLAPVLGALNSQIGRSSLQALVRDTVRAVEQHYIEAALDLTGDNRTAAAGLLGLSRQSLYAKLNRYGLDGNSGHNGSAPD